MPQRKVAGQHTSGSLSGSTGTTLAEVEETVPLRKAGRPVDGPLSLDGGEERTEPPSSGNGTIDEIHLRRLKKWKESPFAAGLTEVDWVDERTRDSYKSDFDHELERDMTGCLCCSAMICPLLGAERVGNMSVLKSTMEVVEEVQLDEETGKEEIVRRFSRPKLQIVVGPYWPMLVLVTYPLIFLVSGLALKAILAHQKSSLLLVAWFMLTASLVVALACTSFSDPGIMYRISDPPPQDEALWRWSDQARTYRPRNARYDTDTAVVVRGFDHTCPWTGTAIGENNMLPFQTFVCLIFVCLVLDIFIITDTF